MTCSKKVKDEYRSNDNKINWAKIEQLIKENSDREVSKITGASTSSISFYRLNNMKIVKKIIAKKDYLDENNEILWQKIKPMYKEKTDIEISELTGVYSKKIRDYRVKLGIGRSRKIKPEFILSNGKVDWKKIQLLYEFKSDKEISIITGLSISVIYHNRVDKENGLDLDREKLKGFISNMKSNPLIFKETYRLKMTEENLVKAYNDSIRARKEYHLFTKRDDDYSFLDKKVS